MVLYGSRHAENSLLLVISRPRPIIAYYSYEQFRGGGVPAWQGGGGVPAAVAQSKNDKCRGCSQIHVMAPNRFSAVLRDTPG